MSLLKNLFVLALGALLGATAIYFIKPELLANAGAEATSSDADKPLYWVAPMDPNYRRDEPGKSPMGMDLVPVYAKDQQGGNDSPGTIEIAPEIVNNLGVRTAKVTTGALQQEVRTVGYLQYNQDSMMHIHPRVDGWIEKSFVTSVGAPVQKGQKLYSLYSPALVNAQEELLFGLKRKDQRMTKAAEERLRALQISSGFIRQLKASGKVSQTVTFYAPAAGVVDNLNMREGLYVQPGQTLLSIANLDQIWLEAEVLERQAGLIKAGLPVQVRLDFLPGDEREAKVDYVYPSLDPQTRTLRVRIRMPNKDHALKPNMFAELRILAGDNQNRLLIPKEAVIRGGQQDRVVLTLGAGRFKSLAVKTGQRDGQQVEILEGLKAGEEVVISAQFLLDSESSKTSDFARIDVDEPVKSDKPSQVWVEIKVNEIYPDKMKVNVDHAPIEAWMWPQMTMDFKLDEFVDLDELKPGLVAHAQVTRTPEKKYLITDLHIPEEGSEKGGMPRQSESADIAGMDHSQHQMPSEADSSKAKEPTQAEKPKKVWVKGMINSIDAKAMKVNAQHEAIPEWSWPEMTMDFKLDEFIDLDELPTGQMLHLEVTRTDGSSYLITDFFLPEAE